MKPSSKTVLCLGAVLCCGALFFADSAAVVQARAGRPVFPAPISSAPISSAPKMMQKHFSEHSGSGEGVRFRAGARHMSREEFRSAVDRRFGHRRQSFGGGYGGGPYLSGSFQSAPLDEAPFEGGPFAGNPPDYAGYPAYDRPRPPPCVVPLIIRLKQSRRTRHMPKITYGSPSFCPPPVVAEVR
jgi:hypothetical protein